MLVAVGLVAALLVVVDWRVSLQTILRIRPAFIAVLFGITAAVIWISCEKWRLFLLELGRDVSVFRLFLLYLVGYFFNNFTPGSVGGDVVRGLILGRESGEKGGSFGSIFMERYTGFIGLVLMALAALAINPGIGVDPKVVRLVVAVSWSVLAASLLLLFEPVERAILLFLDRFPWASARKAGSFVNVVFSFRDKRMVLAKAMGWSLLFHTMTVANVLAACRGLRVEAGFLDLAVLVPMVLLVSAIPVSLNAIGIMEGAFVFFLGAAGVAREDALSIALVLRAKNIVVGLIGGIVFAWLRFKRRGEARDS
jgi:uncharacterized membrane protein YbhN (UPF0104 family)